MFELLLYDPKVSGLSVDFIASFCKYCVNFVNVASLISDDPVHSPTL